MTDTNVRGLLAVAFSAIMVLSVVGVGGVGLASAGNASDASPASGDVTVSGTLTSDATDGSLSGNDARVILQKSGTVVDSTYADSSGNYAFHNVSDGSYTLVAKADYHRDASTGSFQVSGSDVSKSLALEGTVVNENTSDSWTAIQPALDAAATGETITVGPGTYSEALTIATDGLTLRSTDGAAETTVTASSGPAIEINGDNGGATGVAIDGFRLEGSASNVVNAYNVDDIALRNSVVDSAAAGGSASGMFTDGTATVDNVEFRDTDNYGSGLYVSGAAAGTTVTDSEFSGYDRGLYIENSPDTLVSGVVATSNDINGILLRNTDGSTLRYVDISSTFVDDGDDSVKGRAIQIFNSENVDVTKVQLGPSNSDAVGIQADDGGTYDLSTITFSETNVVDNGFGMFTTASDGTLNNAVDATGNYFSGNGGGDTAGSIDASSKAGSAYTAGRDALTDVSGTVSSAAPDGTLAGVPVRLEQSGTLIESVTTDSGGSYEFRNVTDGSYTVVADAPAHRQVRASVSVSESSVTQDVTLAGVVENTRTGGSFTDIGSAISADGVQAGDTIEVAPGTYDESVALTGTVSDLTITSTGAATETVVDGQGSTPTFNVGVDGVTIDGFTITSSGPDLLVNTFDTTQHTVRNNIVRASSGQVGVNTGETLTLVDNEITSSAAEATGIKLYDAGASGTTITENEVTGFGNATTAINADDLTIKRNRFANTGDATGEDAINVDVDSGATVDASTITVAQNNIVDNNFALSVESSGTINNEIDAENNWWGSANGPGQDGANDVAGPIDVEPWLDAAAPDGQAVPTEIIVDAQNPSPKGAAETATYGTNVTIDQVGSETGEYVSVNFGTSTVDLSSVGISDVTVEDPSDTGLGVDSVQTVDSGQTLLIDLGTAIIDPSSGDTYDVTIGNVVNGDESTYTQRVGLHESGSDIGSVAATAYTTASDSYTVGSAPANFAVNSISTDGPVAEGDDLTVDATVENIGGTTATKTVELTNSSGTVLDSQDVKLNGSETKVSTLTWSTTDGDAGSLTLTVSTPDDSRDTSVTVLGERIVGSVTSNAADFTVGSDDVTLTLSQDGSDIESVTTDSNGDYVFSAQDDGDYTLTVTAPNHQSATQTGVTIDSGNTTEDFALDGNVTNTDTGTTYVSIQSAVDGASTGDRITAAPGTYAESVTIAVDNLTLESTGTASETTISTNSGPAIRIDGSNGGSTGVAIDGFSLEAGTSDNNVLNTYGMSDLTVRNASLTPLNDATGGMYSDGVVTLDNVAFQSSSGTKTGVFLDGSGGSTITNTQVDGWGNGMQIQSEYDVTIQNSGIQNNAYTGVNVPATADVSPLTITNSEIVNNPGSTAINIYDDDGDGSVTGTADAERNWWGSANGPGQDGANGVTGPVDVEPWLDSADGSAVPYELSATALDPSPGTNGQVATYGLNVTVDQIGPETIQVFSADFGTSSVDVSSVGTSDVTVSGPNGDFAVNRTVALDGQTLLVELADSDVIADPSSGDTFDLTLSNVSNGDAGMQTLTAGIHASGDSTGGIATTAAANATSEYQIASTISNYAVSNPSDREIQVSFDSARQLDSISVSITGAESATLTESDFNTTDNGDTYTYTATYTGSSDGTYTAALDTAADTTGTDGAIGQSDSATINAPEGAITLDGSPTTVSVEAGQTTTVDVVATAAEAGVGSYELTTALSDDRLAEITAVDLPTGANGTAPDSQSVSISGDGSSADIAAAYLTDPIESGSPTIATLTIEGATTGTVTLSPGFGNVSDANGSTYEVLDTTSSELTITDTTSPMAEAGPDKTVDVGQSVTLDGTGSTDNVGIASYEWDLGNGVASTSPTPTYTYDSTGTYTVTLTVTDGAGNTATDTRTVTVEDTTPPTADAGSDVTVDVGQSVTFDGTGSSDNVGIASHEWAFDDGETSTSLTPTHTYDSPGTYTATLTVTDSAGNTDTDTRTVTVEDTAGPAAFAVTIVDAPATVSQGADIAVTANIENTGGESGTQTVTFLVNGTAVGDSQVTLSSGNSTNVTFNHTIGSTATGERVVAVETEDSSATTTIDVQTPSESGLAITGLTAPSAVYAGDVVSVSADIENIGSQSTDGTVTLAFNGTVVDSDEIQVAGGETETANLTYATSESDIGNATITVDTGDETTTQSVLVKPVVDKYINENGSVDAAGLNEAVSDYVQGDLAASDLNQVIQLYLSGGVELAITDVTAPSKVYAGDVVSVSADIENAGSQSADRTVTLAFNGTVVDSDEIQIAGGETETANLTYTTSESDIGNATITVDTGDDTKTQSILVADVIDRYTDESGDVTASGMNRAISHYLQGDLSSSDLNRVVELYLSDD